MFEGQDGLGTCAVFLNLINFMICNPDNFWVEGVHLPRHFQVPHALPYHELIHFWQDLETFKYLQSLEKPTQSLVSTQSQELKVEHFWISSRWANLQYEKV